MSPSTAVRCFLVFVAILSAAASATTIYVSTAGNDANDGMTWVTAKKTVQAGLNAARSGDQVWMAAGTYVQCITLKVGVSLYGGFAGNETDLTQRDRAGNVTILDGNKAGSVVTAPSGATATTRIDGFTIRNGSGSLGGGIYCSNSSPAISNNTIIGNTAANGGGGIYCSSSSPTITNNIITGNTTSSSSNGDGGGVYCRGSSLPTISNNTITGNTAASYGGGIYCYSCSPMIANNTITGNTASFYGGGISCYSCSPTITNNTIAGNTAVNGGGGIHCSSSSSPTISNTIIAFNSSGIRSVSSTPTLRYCCVCGNGAYNYSGLADPTGANGNISADPQLADVARGNLHLQPTSPCVNTGDETVVQAGWVDMDGQARVQGAHVDIGADESDGTIWPPAAAILYVSPSGNDSNDGLSWSSAKQTVQAAVDAAGTGSQVWVAAGTYVGTIQLRFGMALYGGFGGGETDLSQRNWRTNLTIVDGNQAGSVVTAPLGAVASTRIDGFTIRNGRASVGGGIYCNYSSPTITNNTITGNTATSSSYGGGGIYCYYSSSPTITNNTITGNTATYGGGIYCYYSSSPAITNNAITGNTAPVGGGICCDYSSPTIANNTIAGNSGNGISCYTSSPTITNNTITGNTAHNGGGIYGSSCSSTITNTIIAFNSSGIYIHSGTPTLRYCCVYGNGAYNYSGLTDPTGTDGNISADPLFVHQTVPYDVHLLWNSPCINTGDPSFDGNGLVDLGGSPRVFGGRVDMGAYEFLPPPTIATNTPLPAGAVGSAYSLTFQATGGATPYTWSISAGSLPDGLTLDLATGVISGVPTTATITPASFIVQVTSSDGAFATEATLAITDNNVPRFQWLPEEAQSNLDGPVYAATTWDPDGPGPQPDLLVAGGFFNVAGDVPCSSIAAWNGTSWQPIGSGMNGSVLALTVYNGKLIAGGWFDMAGGVACNNIAAWNGSTWQPLSSGITSDRYWSNGVYALTVYNGQLIAGGMFETAGGAACDNIAAWDGTSWHPLGSGMAMVDPRTAVCCLTVYNGQLIAGGQYIWTAGGVICNNIARWDGTIWQSLGSGITGGSPGDRVRGVHALTVYNTRLVAGGNFANAGEVGCNCIAAWDGTSWQPLGSGMDYSVDALMVYNGQLIAGGWFSAAGGVACNNIAAWDDTSWQALGTGMGGEYPYVNALTVYNGQLIAGGWFTTAGGQVSTYWARGVYLPWLLTQPQSTNAIVGQTVTLSVTASGTDPLTYQWLRDGAPLSDDSRISGTHTASLAISSVTPDDAGSYECVVTNASGFVTSNPAALTILILPPTPTDPTPSDSATDVPVASSLSWTGAADGVTFDVYLDTVNPPQTKVAARIPTASFSPALAPATQYYWQVIATNAAGQTPGPVWSFATHLTGDVNGDGYVNVGDLQALVAAWGSGPNYTGAADCNGDSYVNVGDLQILVANWGRSVN